MTGGKTRHMLPRPYRKMRKSIRQRNPHEGVSTRHEQWKGSVGRTGNSGAISCAGGPAHESSSGRVGKTAWSGSAGWSTAKPCSKVPSSTIDRLGGQNPQHSSKPPREERAGTD